MSMHFVGIDQIAHLFQRVKTFTFAFHSVFGLVLDMFVFFGKMNTVIVFACVRKTMTLFLLNESSSHLPPD